MPCAPWIISPTNHHSEVIAVRTVIRSPARNASAGLTSRSTKVACTNHRIGPTITSTNDVAFTPPTVSVTSANTAGACHPPRRNDLAASPISQGNPAKGSRITLMRAA